MSTSPLSGSTTITSMAVLSDHDLGLDKVSLFSATNMRAAGTIPAGTIVSVLGPSGLSGYVLVMTLDGNVFEVWHENIRYTSHNNRSKSTLNLVEWGMRNRQHYNPSPDAAREVEYRRMSNEELLDMAASITYGDGLPRWLTTLVHELASRMK
jgi:hypothetical protein